MYFSNVFRENLFELFLSAIHHKRLSIHKNIVVSNTLDVYILDIQDHHRQCFRLRAFYANFQLFKLTILSHHHIFACL